jgi:hypothetical protein
MPGPDEPTPHGDRIRALERSRLAGVFRPQDEGDDAGDGEPERDATTEAAEPLRRPARPLPPVLAAHVLGTAEDVRPDGAEDDAVTDAEEGDPEPEDDGESTEDEVPRRRLLRGRRRSRR